jgi:ABC-type spermidine/putrescine transport system permease subunit II
MPADTHQTDAGQSHRDQTGGSSRKHDSLWARVLLALATTAVAALIGSPMAQAFIMKDGQICDPIRHMGC